MKPTSHGALAENASSFSRLRRAGPRPFAGLRATSLGTPSAASLQRRAARCPTPRRNVRNPLVDASTQALRPPDATASDTEFPDAATRHEPPDAPRSGTELSDASPSGAGRPEDGSSEAFSSPAQNPRRMPFPCRASAAQSRPAPYGLAVQRGPWAPAETGLPRLRAEPILRRAQNVFLRRSGQLPHLVQSCSDQPDGEIKAPGFSQTRARGKQEGRSRWTTRGDSRPSRRA